MKSFKSSIQTETTQAPKKKERKNITTIQVNDAAYHFVKNVNNIENAQ